MYSISPMPATYERERILIRLLATFLLTGIFFMILPGTFLGVWNLFAISAEHSPYSVSPAWIQAHGHAQLFGWVGSFILGIGIYSTPNLRRLSSLTFWEGWLSWFMWTLGISLRWFVNIYQWQWRLLLPWSSFLELGAVLLLLLYSIEGHRNPKSKKNRLQPWSIMIMAGTIGLAIACFMNLVESLVACQQFASPAFPTSFQNRFLVVASWGFVIPIAWGFSAHWFPAFLGLKKQRTYLLWYALILNASGVFLAISAMALPSSLLIFAATLFVINAIRIFEPSAAPAKTAGIHVSFPLFIRLAYAWLFLSSLILIGSAVLPNVQGLAGAGRHALTVGFVATMILSVGPRIIPAFLARQKLFSKTLMFITLLTLNCGCLIRVFSEIIAYQDHLPFAWALLPISATLELLAISLFVINIIGTVRQPVLTPSCTT